MYGDFLEPTSKLTFVVDRRVPGVIALRNKNSASWSRLYSCVGTTFVVGGEVRYMISMAEISAPKKYAIR